MAAPKTFSTHVYSIDVYTNFSYELFYPETRALRNDYRIKINITIETSRSHRQQMWSDFYLLMATLEQKKMRKEHESASVDVMSRQQVN